MSFILDALKKSEIERQRQSAPGLMDTRMARRRSGLPVWALLLGALLGVNCIVLLVLLMRNGAPARPPAPARHAEAAAAPGANSSADSQAHFSPLDPTPVYAPEIPAAGSDNHSPTSHAAAPLPRALHRPDPVLTGEDAPAENEEVLPSISEINLTGADALPELHLDVHVYSTKPADRFVYINMRKYREGAMLQEGPIVERIRRDGAVLNFHGVRFVLPRQS